MGVLNKITKAILGEGSVTGVTPPITQGDITYYGDAARQFNLQISKTNTESNRRRQTSIGDSIDNWDIAQSHFFTVQIYSAKNEGYPYPTGLHDKNGAPFSFSSGLGTYKNYLPIKSMNFSYTSYENMSIPLNIFGDFPLLHRKKMSAISITCYDMDQDVIELALREWEKQCFPQNCVEYMDCIKAEFRYRSYDVTGKMNFEKVLEVIPTGSVSVSRSYEENNAKLLNFSLIVVGASGASAQSPKGSGSVIKEAGYGDGNDNADLVYEKSTSAILMSQNRFNQNIRYE